MFILWGDLEERKTAAAEAALAEKDLNSTSDAHAPVVSSAQPFECCVKEYGTPIKLGAAEEGEDADEETAWTGWQRRWRMFGTTIV